MRRALLPALVAFPALAQLPRPGSPPGPPSPPVASREWVFGRQLARNIEQREGRYPDLAFERLLTGIATKLTTGFDTPEVRITRSPQPYLVQLPSRLFYVSAGLLARTASEAEMAGFLAHGLAHGSVYRRPPDPSDAIIPNRCALARQFTLPATLATRADERAVTAAALPRLAAAGYDASALLDGLSKIAYDFPTIGRTIHPDDILDLRHEWEQKPLVREVIVDSSQFADLRDRVRAELGQIEAISPRFGAEIRHAQP